MRKSKNPKQVKSFSTDARVYDWLVAKINQSGSDISISELINDYLGYLYYEVKSILDYYEHEKIKVDVPWIISRIIRESMFFPPKLDVLYADPDMKRWMGEGIHSRAMDFLEEYQKEQKLIMDNIRERRIGKERQRVSEIEKRLQKKGFEQKGKKGKK